MRENPYKKKLAVSWDRQDHQKFSQLMNYFLYLKSICDGPEVHVHTASLSTQRK